MNEKKNHESLPQARREMSRRQFLSYTLGGTGAFMVGTPLIFNIAFAVDPLLKKKGAAEFVKVAKVSDIKDKPAVFKFKKHQVDGWYESDAELQAWISYDKNKKVYALSPICKHLGCTVAFQDSLDQYVCPCHGAHYTEQGKNLIVAPAPLDEYQVKIENDWVYLGGIIPNQHV